jgi:tetratricopeptide (TPR) repeat protein
MLGGAILSGDGLVRECDAQLEAAAEALPEDADKAAMVALAMFRIGNVRGVRACLENPDVARTISTENLLSLAHVNQLLGEHAKSLMFMDRAKALGYDNADFRYFRGVQLQFNGRLEEAAEEMEACLQMGPTFGRASYTLARLRRQTAESNHLAYIHDQLKRVEPGSEDHASFEFALFKEYEDLGNFEDAWAALERGNAVMQRRLKYDSAEENELLDAIIAQTPPDFLERGRTEFAGPTPIFVIGMPRSGTTLLERILGNHSMVQSSGELSDFSRQMQWLSNRYSWQLLDKPMLAHADRIDYAALGRRYLEQTQWRANDKPYYIDKLPPNYLLAGFIRRALPDAPILHMMRDPMDTCFSNYKAMFGHAYAYSYDLHSLAQHYRNYRRLMEHWHSAMPGHILDVSYKELVTDTDAVVRKILSYCRLPYEPGCADLSRNSTPVATMSSAQARKQINDSSLGEWRRYARQLAPLGNAIEKID